MPEHKQDRTKWIQIGLISFLTVLVAILASMVFRMQGQLEALGRHEPVAVRSALPDPAPPPPVPKPAPPPGKRDDPFDIDDDWFSRPFDPNKWDPFAEMQRMQEQMNRMFNDSFGHFGRSPRFRGLAREPSFSPKIDVHEEDDRFVVRLDLPGVEEGSLDVRVEGKKLRITGKRESVVDEKDQGGRIMRQERRIGDFARTVELPAPVDASRMEVKNEQGVFTIILPKVPETDAVI